MRFVLTLAVLNLVFTSAAFAATPKIDDQTWTCSFNDQKSARRLVNELDRHPKYRSKGDGDFFGMHLTDVTSISVTIKDGKIVDGNVSGARGNPTDGDSWDLKKTDEYSYVRAPEATANGVQFEFGYDYYDHYNYTVRFLPKSKTAVITLSAEVDCVGSSLGIAVYDCNLSK